MSESTLIDELLNEKWKELLKLQLSPDTRVQREASKRLQDAISESEQRQNKDLWINEKDIPRLIQIGMTMQFPCAPGSFFSAGLQILNWFWTVVHPCIPPAIETWYEAAHVGARRSALVILVAQRTSEALTILQRLIVRNGFPEYMQPRFFWELNNCVEFADVLLPQLLLNAGSEIGGIVDFVNVLDTRGKLKNSHLQGADELVERKARETLSVVKRMQRDSARCEGRARVKYRLQRYSWPSVIGHPPCCHGGSHVDQALL